MMATGTVKWLDRRKAMDSFSRRTAAKTYSSIISAVERAGLSSLEEGQLIEYELVSNRGKQSAEISKRVDRGGASTS
jgi:cold shock protein